MTATNNEVEWSIGEACGQSCSQENRGVFVVSRWIQQIPDSFPDAPGTIGMDFAMLVALGMAFGMRYILTLARSNATRGEKVSVLLQLVEPGVLAWINYLQMDRH